MLLLEDLVSLEDEIHIASEGQSSSLLYIHGLFSWECYTLYYVLSKTVAREKSGCMCVLRGEVGRKGERSEG